MENFQRTSKKQKMFGVRNFYATCKQGLKYQKVGQRLGALPPDTSTFLNNSDNNVIEKKCGMFSYELIKLRYQFNFLF